MVFVVFDCRDAADADAHVPVWHFDYSFDHDHPTRPVFASIGDMVAYTALLTLFSKSVPPAQCGWAMGIAASVMAVAWAFTGLAPNLLGIVALGPMLIGAGVLVLAAGAVLMAAPTLESRSLPAAS